MSWHRHIFGASVTYPRFSIGDIVLTPDDDLVEVVYLAHDGRIAVESPWSAAWTRYEPSQLRHPDDGS